MSPPDDRVCSYDLHLHSCWSFDAHAEPESYFRRATELGVSCIALTEHHAIDSLAEVLEISPRYPGVTAIPAAELTVTTSIGAVDLLCYGFRAPLSKPVMKVMADYRAWQNAAGAATWKGLQALGYDFCESDLVDLLASYRPPRALAAQGHTEVKYRAILNHCVERGFVTTGDEYNDLIGRFRRAGSWPAYPDVQDVVPVVKAAGAVVAIAHPFLEYFAGHDERRMDLLRHECALDGIECAHHTIPVEVGRLYRQYCQRHGLFSVGGSDSHGYEGDLEHRFARQRGEDEWLDELLARIELPL